MTLRVHAEMLKSGNEFNPEMILRVQAGSRYTSRAHRTQHLVRPAWLPPPCPLRCPASLPHPICPCTAAAHTPPVWSAVGLCNPEGRDCYVFQGGYIYIYGNPRRAGILCNPEYSIFQDCGFVSNWDSCIYAEIAKVPKG
jgi:hypothetical protein